MSRLLLVPCLLLGLAPLPVLAQEDAAATNPAVAKARAASVEILVDGRLDGTGWIASKEGDVITAAHVVWNKHDRLEVHSPRFGRHPARIVATDPAGDLARLRIEFPDKPPAGLAFLEIAPEMPAEGATVYLHGSALFRHAITVRGAVARRQPGSEKLEVLNYYGAYSYIAAPSPPGTSGGSWVDREGRVVGSQSGFLNAAPGVGAGIAMVAPPASIREILKAEGDQERATLGCGLEELWTQNPGFIRRLPEGVSGLVTFPMPKDSPAAKAGLHRESLITAVEGRPVKYRRDLMSLLWKKKPGDKVQLDVVGPDEKPRKVEVTLGGVKRPGG